MKDLRKNLENTAVFGALALGIVTLSAPVFAGDGCKGGNYGKPQAGAYGMPGYHGGYKGYAPMTGYGPHAPRYMAPAGYMTPVGMGYSAEKKGYGSSKSSMKPDIVATAKAAGSFNTLLSALNAAELTSVLEGDGPFTVFAPTDEAFANLPEGTLEALLADKEKLAAILKYHVVAGELTAKDVTAKSELDTVEGSKLPTGSISVAKADIMASNGVIHVIDEVLVPPSI
jgi:uncharacterized surface protein with fasciclin (FAS1) repeats